MSILAGFLGFLAAVFNAATNVLQRAANRTEDQRLEFSLQLIINLARKPIWLASILTITASFALQAAGLGLGTLAAVEPLLVLELPLSLIGARLFLGSRLGPREWGSIGVMTAGTIGLIASLAPKGGSGSGIGWEVWAAAIAITVAPIAAVYWVGRTSESPGRRAGVLGIGAGLGYGLAAAMTKGMTTQFSSGGMVGVLTAWQLYGAIAAGGLAFWMDQNAITAGRLAAAQPGITLGDPCVSILWGATVFSESMRGGLWIVAAVACAAAIGGSAIALAGAAATSGEQAARDEGQPDEEAADGKRGEDRQGEHRQGEDRQGEDRQGEDRQGRDGQGRNGQSDESGRDGGEDGRKGQRGARTERAGRQGDANAKKT